MTEDQYGRTGREWRFCAACQRADALLWRMVNDVKALQCRYCHPIKAAPAHEGIFA